MAEGQFIGFFSLNSGESQEGYIGSILVLDELGRPVEFRVSYPVKPTGIQRILYGDTLEPFIGTELCGKPLIQSLQHHLSLLLVDSECLLAVRSAANCPTVLIGRAGELVELAPEPGNQEAHSEPIESASGRFQPIVIQAAPSHLEDIETSRPLIEQLYRDFDLLEPFERVERAVAQLVAQDKRFH